MFTGIPVPHSHYKLPVQELLTVYVMLEITVIMKLEAEGFAVIQRSQ
jgi:hypothetical protein